MATRNEKIICSFIGVAFGGVYSYYKAKKNENSKLLNATIKGSCKGGISGRFFAEIFGTANDTVNYTLYDRDEIVYEGIAYEDRIEARIKEHLSNGKFFDSFENDKAIPRIDALKKEKKRIKMLNPKYNIQHNS